MIFDFHSDGYELVDADKNFISERIEKLKKYNSRLTDESVKVHVKVVRGTRHNSPNFGIRVQITIPGGSLRGEASGPHIQDAVDAVELKLKNQIEKLD